MYVFAKLTVTSLKKAYQLNNHKSKIVFLHSFTMIQCLSLTLADFMTEIHDISKTHFATIHKFFFYSYCSLLYTRVFRYDMIVNF